MIYMKDREVLSESQKQEALQFMRPVSMLVAFAKSLRNEGEQVDPAKGAAEGSEKTPPNPFDALDLNDFDTDIRARLVAAKTAFTETQNRATQAEQKQKQTEEFGRKQQSIAAKAVAKLRSHNLDSEGPVTPAPSGENSKFQARYDRLIKEGMAEPQAKAYAKMLSDEAAATEREILDRMGPVAARVATLDASTFLSDTKREFPDVFKHAEIDKEVTDNINLMVQRGNPVNKDTVAHLTQMAWGKFILDPANAEKVNKINSQGGGNAEIPRFGSSFNTGALNNDVSRGGGNNKGPVARQPETSKIMSELNNYWKADMPKAKGKK